MSKARTLADIVAHPFVESTHTEYDGCFGGDVQSRWVYLKPGYISPDNECGSIHERNVRDCCAYLNDARRATLEEIKIQGYTLAEAQANWAAEDASNVLAENCRAANLKKDSAAREAAVEACIAKREAIGVGDHVRAWDFEPMPNRRDRYVEGIVKTINDNGTLSIHVTHDTAFALGDRFEICTAVRLILCDFADRITVISTRSQLVGIDDEGNRAEEISHSQAKEDRRNA